MQKRGVWIVTLLAAMLPGLAIAGEAASDLTQVRQRGKLIMICFPHQNSEFISVNLKRGPMRPVGTLEDFQGFDVDVMAAFAGSLGVTLEIRPIATPGYGELIPALLRGDGDLIASSFSITEARREQVGFSRPYFTVKELVITRKDSPIRSLADLAGKTAATIAGSAQEEHLKALKSKGLTFWHVAFTIDAFIAVNEGTANFTLQDSPTLRQLAEFHDLRAAFSIGEGTQYGYAVRKGSDLLEPLDGLVAKLREGGRLAELEQKWGVRTP